MISEMENDPESDEILSLTGVSAEEFSKCACEKVEALYESESEAGIALEQMTEEEVGILILSCFGDIEDLSEGYGEGWSEELATAFLEGCIGEEPSMEGYCTCVLGNIMTDFDASDIDYWGEEDYEALAELYSDCLELISY